MYRVRVRKTADGLGLVLSDRAVARLCLEEGDEIVIAEIVRHSAIDGVEDAAETGGAAPVSGPPARPAAETAPGPRAGASERDLAAFRRLGR